MREWRNHRVDEINGLELNDDLELNNDQDLADVSDAMSQVSDRTKSSINNTANRVPDTFDTDNSIVLEPLRPSPRTPCRAHPSRVPSQILHIDALLDRHMFEPSIHMFAQEGRKVHGICHLPHGFALAPVGITATVAELDDVRNHEESLTKLQPKADVEISSSYSLAQGLVAVFQTLYASTTLYRARGDQIERYGYAAFGLTVAPYLVMSIINLVSTILTPSYPTQFMVESEIMREAARRDGAQFNGVVGILKNDQSVRKVADMVFKFDEQGHCSVRQQRSTSSSAAHGNTAPGVEAMEVSRQRWLIELDTKNNDRIFERILLVPASHHRYSSPYFIQGSLITFLRLLVGLTSLAINGALSRFKVGNSTRAQRVWTMTWLAFGIYAGSGILNVARKLGEIMKKFGKVPPEREVRPRKPPQRGLAGLLGMTNQLVNFFIVVVVYGAISIGGLVVVCQMLLHYGNCTRIY